MSNKGKSAAENPQQIARCENNRPEFENARREMFHPAGLSTFPSCRIGRSEKDFLQSLKRIRSCFGFGIWDSFFIYRIGPVT
jgi:hypothetical protein